MELRRVVYFVARVLTDRDVDRFGITTMVDNGISVTVVEGESLTHPKMAKSDRSHYSRYSRFVLQVVEHRSQLREIKGLLDRADLIIFLAESRGVCRSNLALARLLARTRTPYLVMAGSVVPGYDKNKFIHRATSHRGALLPTLLKKDYLDSLVVRIPHRWFGIPDADYILHCSPGIRRRKDLVGPRTRHIVGYAPDYQNFLSARSSAGPARDQAIFVDQMLPFHPDFGESRTRGLEASRYFKQISAFFDRVEEKTGLEVVIAGHPRGDYARNGQYFGSRRIILGSTAKAVIESRLILSHATTAISFAALGLKPLMLLASEDIYQLGAERFFLQAFADELDTPLLRYDRPDEWDGSIPVVNRAAYDRYVRTYVKNAESPDQPLWQIVIDSVRKGDPPDRPVGDSDVALIGAVRNPAP